ncbi:MAG: FtsQ-type POTRA domain-containing protein [Desulfobacteraceae bacterium]|nr:FtsQ-type POTRA domain-containing protein [Desulfobacteraceae bacterium]
MVNRRIRQNKLRSGDSKISILEFDFMNSLDLGLKFILVVVAVSLFSLGLIFAHDLVTQSSYFGLKQINVTGNDTLGRAEVLSQAEISEGDNLLSINLNTVSSRLIAHPWIRDAAVTRRIPSTITISVIEEHAVAKAVVDSDFQILLDAEGQPFKRYDPGLDSLAAALPEIFGLKLESMGQKYGFSGKLHNAVMEVLALEGRDRIDTITADRDVGIKIKTRIFDGRDAVGNTPITLKLGFDGFQAKLNNAEQIIDYMETSASQKRLCSIDMFNIRSVTVTLEDKDIMPGTIKGGA